MDAPTQFAKELRPIETSLGQSDRYHLTVLQAEVRVREQELTLARVRLDASRAVSDAAADQVLDKLGLPLGASEVTIDLNGGVVRYLPPTGA